MPPFFRSAALLIAGVITLAACSSGSGSPAPSSSSATGSANTLGSGFYNSNSPPPPEGTITPSPGSWANANPPAGYRAALVTAGTDAQTRVIAQAVQSWAAAQHVRLTLIKAAPGSGLLTGITKAVKLAPNLVISAGNELVDPLATVTASNLQQQFLIVGAEIAEPTGNVTAADWTGAAFRGEGLGTPAHYDPKSFTPDRAGRAVRAGVAAVVNKHTGIVVWIS